MAYDTALIIGFVGVSFIMAYISMNLNRREHGALQLLFLTLSFYSVWGTFTAMLVMLEEQSITNFNPLIESFMNVFIWGGVFLIFYMIVYFIYNLIRRATRHVGKAPEFESGEGYS